MYKPLLFIPTLLLLITAAFQAHAASPGAMTRYVIVAPVTSRVISDHIEALGTAHATESTNITASVNEKVTKIYFDDGQRVKSGDILVELDHSEEKAELKRAQAIRGERKLTLDRLLKLEKQQLTAPDEIDRTRLELEQAEATISAINTRIQDRLIRAPFAGVVGLREISIGTLVESGDIITTLDDTRQIKLDFTVPSVFLLNLKPGLSIRARATALGEMEFEGEIQSLNSRIDPQTRSIKVRSLLANQDGRILPGLMMQVDLLYNTRQALVVPEAALLPLADSQYVMLRVTRDGKDMVEKRQVTTGTRLAGYVEILDGLKVGDEVVTHGHSKVNPGDKVTVLAVDDGSVDISTILQQRKITGDAP